MGVGKLGQGNRTALYKIEGEVFSAPPKNDFGDEAGETVQWFDLPSNWGQMPLRTLQGGILPCPLP